MSQFLMFENCDASCHQEGSECSLKESDFKSLCSSLEVSHLEGFLKNMGYMPVAGVDEAGRGPLAGPVIACACILPENYNIPGLTDSKKLTASEREKIYHILTSDTFGVQYAVVAISHEEIDRINILQATMKAMSLALQGLQIAPGCALIDGNRVPHNIPSNLPAYAVVKGDLYCPSISAASIIAKVTRDRIVDEYDKEWPHFQFRRHKGYGTKLHLDLIRQYGCLPVHRKTFKPIQNEATPRQTTLF